MGNHQLNFGNDEAIMTGITKVLICALALIAVSNGQDEEAKLCATLYKNHLRDADSGPALKVYDAVAKNYKGTNAPKGWNNKVSSFEIEAGCELTGYENRRRNGHMFSFTQGKFDAPKDNTMSSWICTCAE